MNKPEWERCAEGFEGVAARLQNLQDEMTKAESVNPLWLSDVAYLAGFAEGSARMLRKLHEEERVSVGDNVQNVLDTWKRDQHPIMSKEVQQLIGEIEEAIDGDKEGERRYYELIQSSPRFREYIYQQEQAALKAFGRQPDNETRYALAFLWRE